MFFDIQVGLPIGLNHLIFQSPTGQPQMYRIVLGSNAASPFGPPLQCGNAQPLSPTNQQQNPNQHLSLQLQSDVIHPTQNRDQVIIF